MDKITSTNLTWHGQETIQTILHLLDHTQQIEIHLPDSYNHALFTTVHPGVPSGQFEDMNSSGGSELFATIANVKGLEGFRQLVDMAFATDVIVEISTPATILIKHNSGNSESASSSPTQPDSVT